MIGVHFAFFDTAVGRCGIAWGERGIVAVLLPEKNEAAARARLARRFPEGREAEPTPEIGRTLDAIGALLAGAARNLADVALDMEGVPDFHRRVYEVARTIRPGSTLSYGEIAKRIGEPGAARDVGEALGRNPFPIVVPCHRVLAAGGKLGGFSARGGVATKLKLLDIEGALKPEAPLLFEELPRALRRA
jgi:methylated-DNA-[protein]-cysteine S-methyltransferase